nr:ORF171 [Cavernulicola chilensis]
MKTIKDILRNINIIHICLGLVILNTLKVIIVNEETLILLCFVIFVILVISITRESIAKELDQRSYKMKRSIDESFEDIELQLRKIVSLCVVDHNLSSQLYFLKNVCDTNSNNVINKVKENLSSKTHSEFSKRLIIIDNTENEINILLRTLLCVELDKIVEINRFHNGIGISRFVVMNQLINQERIISI